MSCICLELLHINVKIQINSFIFGFAHFMCESSTLSCWQFNIPYYGRTLLRMAEHTSAIVRHHLQISWQQKKEKKKTWFKIEFVDVLSFRKDLFIAQGNPYLHLTHNRKLPKKIYDFFSFLLLRFVIQWKVTRNSDRTRSSVWCLTPKFSQWNLSSATMQELFHNKLHKYLPSKIYVYSTKQITYFLSTPNLLSAKTRTNIKKN